MNRRGLALAILTATACRSDGEAPVAERSIIDTTQAEARTIDQLPPTPDIPAARRGHLSAISAGNYLLSGQWRAEATLCDSLALLELFAGVRGMRTLLVVRFDAEDGFAAGSYPLALLDSTAASEVPVAQLGAQVFQESDATGFQAIEGEVELLTGDGFVSGWFDAVLRESQSHLLVRYVGAFERVRITRGNQDFCDQLGGEALDSAVVDTEDVADTLD